MCVGEDAQQKLEEAVKAGCDVVFTTTPKLMADCLKAAVKYPQVKFLNCSLNMTHPDVRTYYGRIHEAKFLWEPLRAQSRTTTKSAMWPPIPPMDDGGHQRFCTGRRNDQSPGKGVSGMDRRKGL